MSDTPLFNTAEAAKPLELLSKWYLWNPHNSEITLRLLDNNNCYNLYRDETSNVQVMDQYGSIPNYPRRFKWITPMDTNRSDISLLNNPCTTNR